MKLETQRKILTATMVSKSQMALLPNICDLFSLITMKFLTIV